MRRTYEVPAWLYWGAAFIVWCSTINGAASAIEWVVAYVVR